MNIKHENLIGKGSGGILLYFLIAQTVVTKILPLKRQSRNVKFGKFKKGLFSQYPFAV